MRDLGEALILLDQNPSMLTTPALGNTGVTICLNLKHADDLEAAGKALTLPRDEWEHIGRLPVGQAIVKLQDRWLKPFLVDFPLFSVPDTFQPFQAKRDDSGGDSVKRVVEELRSALNGAISALPQSARRNRKSGGITGEERGFLCDIARHPLATVTERHRRLGLSARKGTEIKWRLSKKGLVKQEKVSTPRGCVALLKLTDEGCTVLRYWGVPVRTLPKNASLEHEYWKKIVAEEYRMKGYDVGEEVNIGDGKAVDLVATKDGKKIAIEIETGKSDMENNIRKCRKAGFTNVIVVPTKDLACKQFSRKIDSMPVKTRCVPDESVDYVPGDNRDD